MDRNRFTCWQYFQEFAGYTAAGCRDAARYVCAVMLTHRTTNQIQQRGRLMSYNLSTRHKDAFETVEAWGTGTKGALQGAWHHC